jgi:hypothetical protein
MTEPLSKEKLEQEITDLLAASDKVSSEPKAARALQQAKLEDAEEIFPEIAEKDLALAADLIYLMGKENPHRAAKLLMTVDSEAAAILGTVEEQDSNVAEKIQAAYRSML